MDIIGLLTQTLVNGTLLGGIYALLAVGLSLCWGTMKVANSAHAAFAILGAYISYWAFTLIGMDPFVTIPLSFAIVFILGALMERYVVSRLQEYAVMCFLVTFAIATLLENAMVLFWRNDIKSIVSGYTAQVILVGGVIFPLVRTVVFVISLITIASMVMFLRHTRVGKAIRALAQNKDVASLMGINVRRLYTLSFGLATGMAAIGGSLLGQIYAFSPSYQTIWLGKIFAIVMFGGLGTIFETTVSAFVFAFLEVFIGMAFSISHATIATYVIMVVIIMIRSRRKEVG